ncbi:protein FAR1-RELATED SEQUENCE 5-like, partial [Prunus avium]|uniref:Protein FAR1-RELATED SEQUENCE 5-like n=1 Tax=Prunus avium TaxID=42229 RepID=A0A6P5TMM5_PRUAV
IFNSQEALLNWSHVQGRKCGIVVVIKRSDGVGKIITRRARVTLGCERGGHYIKKPNVDLDDEQPMNSEVDVSIDHRKKKKKRSKSTGTKKCGYPFQLKGLNIGPGDEWKVGVVCGVHNHHSAEYLEGHSYAGRLSKEENNLLMDMSKSLVRPKDILYTIKRRDGKNVTTMKTIYNARHKSRVVEKASRSEMQLLLCRLSDHKYINWHRTDDTNCVSDLFWAHPDSVNLLHAFPHVLVMDCTYKTNRFRYPLLQIVGVTSTKLTFSAAFAYISSEKEDNYMWALNRLKSIMNTNCLPSVIVTDREMALMNAIRNMFPSVRHLLCRWHINRCVMKACKGILKKGEKWEQFIVLWNMLVLAKTEVDYERNLLEMDRIFEGKYSKALDYVKVNWLKEYKDRFVAVWTDTCMHFGNTTSNRAESAHSQLKRQLGTSQCNFETSWAKIHAMLVLQHTEIKASFEKSQSFVQHEFNKVSLLKDLIGYVSIVALEEILCESKRIQYVGADPIACGCVIRRSHGLPCAHEMAELSRVFRPIPLHCVHPHWRKLDMFPTAQINDNLDSPEDAKIDVFVNWFKSNDSDTKRHIGMKLQEIMDPKSSTLREFLA